MKKLHRWAAEIDYQHADGIRTRVHPLEELSELHDIVENGPNFYAISAIRIGRPRIAQPVILPAIGRYVAGSEADA